MNGTGVFKEDSKQRTRIDEKVNSAFVFSSVICGKDDVLLAKTTWILCA